MKNWRKYLPCLRVKIKLPFIRIESTIGYERTDCMNIEWYGLDINVWKYEFRVALYWKPIYF